jgi:hypothetical protein
MFLSSEARLFGSHRIGAMSARAREQAFEPKAAMHSVCSQFSSRLAHLIEGMTVCRLMLL